MKKEDLSKDQRRRYDEIVERMLREIEEQNPDQYHKPGMLDGKATRIYIEAEKSICQCLTRYLRRRNVAKDDYSVLEIEPLGE